MNPLTRFVRLLGNDGAVANTKEMLAARQREAWLVEQLERRLQATDVAAASRDVPVAA